MTFYIKRIAGPAEQVFGPEAGGGGLLFHAVVGGGTHQQAVCGAMPHVRAPGWSAEPGRAVTCPRCIRKMDRIHYVH
jgi:hypothetical protein